MKSRLRLSISLLILWIVCSIGAAHAEEDWKHATTVMGEPKYPAGFAHFDYVNPDAPKGGTLKLAEDGTFDTFNPVLSKGAAAVGLQFVFDTLMKANEGEVSTSYGLIAEAVSFPDDISSTSFRIRKEARWADGEPITPEDVIFSFESAKAYDPRQASYYSHVTSAEKTGEREVTFFFDEKNNRELPQILGQLLIVPKHWWAGEDARGRKRDISKTTLEPVMGSGPYRIAAFSPGSSIRYELRDDYWAKDLNVNVGKNNFGSISYTYFADSNVELEAFRGGVIDYRQENSASAWATKYAFPDVLNGKVILEEVKNPLRATGIMQAFVPNMRRDKFKDERVRLALNYAFDFETLNKNFAYNGLTRIDSYFWGTELASSGLPSGREKDILEELQAEVPEEVFTTPYTNPVGGDWQRQRANLREAVRLFKLAGYEIRGTRMVNVETGRPFGFEILLQSASMERTVLPYVNDLKRLGIKAWIRTVDDSQYINRVRSFDYDMIWAVWAQSLNPGNEQYYYWGSQTVDAQGSRNYAGIADTAIDKLISEIVFAKDREQLVPTVHALDRVLLAHHYVIPLFYSKAFKIAYRSTIAHPKELPYYGLGFPEVWWSREAEN